MISEKDIDEFVNDALKEKKKFKANFKRYKQQIDEDNEFYIFYH